MWQETANQSDALRLSPVLIQACSGCLHDPTQLSLAQTLLAFKYLTRQQQAASWIIQVL